MGSDPPASPDPPDRLDRYRAKRAPGRTPEPFGGDPSGAPAATAVTAGRLFVFHKHHARNLHWDLRLELDGALESWAVPKGPSPNPADKRLAVHVEPHPLDYAEFEGVIPEGEYGAGPSIVWDKGTWTPLEDPREGLEKGKLLFELKGYKVRGVWTLVHTPRSGDSHWLLIKELGDAYVDREGGTGGYPDDSIYSGLEVDELPDAERIRREVAERAADAGAPEATVTAADIEVVKATAREEPFDDDGWVFEIKYDGYRLVAGKEEPEPGTDITLLSRNGNDLTAAFPEVARAFRGLPYGGLVVDGEVVVHDERGLPSFGRLQKRGRLQNPRDIARAALELPATFYAFDLLAVEGRDLRPLPLLERKGVLRELLPTAGPIRYSDHVPGRGTAVYEQVTELGLEGIVAKRADSPYRGGRSKSWYKIRTVRTDDFVVVGWKEGGGGVGGFGSLHLAKYRAAPGGEGDELLWMGTVGTGFTADFIDGLHPELVRLEEVREGTDDPTPVVAPEGSSLPRGRESHWIAPRVVAEVQYREVTEAGVLRHPSFLRLRDDKDPGECRLEAVDDGALAEEALPEPASPEAVPPDRTVHFTNLDKVFWPAGEPTDDAPAYTKGDLVAYYEAIAAWLLPYLRDRPLVLTRYPDGIHGKSFYQKDAPAWAPDWIRTATVPSGSGEKELDYFVAQDVETLLYLANLGTVPLHVWHSRVASLDRPDWCLLDLDPKDAPFADVVQIALWLHDLLEEIALPHYVKTSGSTGLHVMIPLGGRMTYDQSRDFGQLLATLAVRGLPEIATVERSVTKRGGRVYVDYLQNRRGQLVAAPFCVRARPGATVSAPLRWKEVGPKLSIADHTIASVPRRMRALKEGDPMRPLLEEAPDLLRALEALQERMAEG